MIEVCKEEKMAEILGRYKAYNNHAESYTWKYHCNPLNMEKTLGKPNRKLTGSETGS